jgi:hypothetical protein
LPSVFTIYNQGQHHPKRQKFQTLKSGMVRV